MLKKKNNEAYVAEIAKEFGISKKAVRSILNFGMKNVCRMIARGEDIHLNHFGTFYFNKKAFAEYLKKGREIAKENRNNNHSSNDLGTNTNK
jgi:nucleoid DNA-binding protein